MEMDKRDRFELLSAYLDGEVTAAERQQIEDWLTTDPVVKHLYARVLKLHQGLRVTQMPPAQQPVGSAVEQVFPRLNKRPKMAVVWVSAAIAAVLLGAVSSKPMDRQTPVPINAQAPTVNPSQVGHISPWVGKFQ